MADKTLIDILKDIFADKAPDRIKQDEFWERVQKKTKIDSQTKDLFKRLSDRQQIAFLALDKNQRDPFLRSGKKPQIAFFEDLWDLAQQEPREPLDSQDRQDRQDLYRRLAYYYNCVFKWVEEREPGGTPEVVP